MKFYISLYFAKLINLISNILKFGSGYTWPGHFALKIYPDILDNKKLKFPKGVILISGTNGKTTTSKLVTHFLSRKAHKVVNNKTGANLLNGIVSEILLSMDIFGRHNSDIGVFEVDEQHLPEILKYIPPRTLVLLNLSRDQLDRYGEVDHILLNWEEELSKLNKGTKLVIDGSQEYFESLKQQFEGEIETFDADKEYLNHTNLVGSFNAKNLNAAITVVKDFGLNEEEIIRFSKSFKYAYGRGEIVELKNKTYKILLAKNPASFNNNLIALTEDDIDGKAILFILNDNIPDGRDVSWIYDIKPELLARACEGKKVLVSGKRFLDMAVRLKYAGVEINKDYLFENLISAVDFINHDTKEKDIVILPNYSAMLNVRKVLTGKEIL